MADPTSRVSETRRCGRECRGGGCDEGGGRQRWTISAFLFFATTINYMDRQVIGILAPELQQIIGWSEIQYGHIITAFQFAYAIGLLLGGGVIDRMGTRMGYALSIGMWSLAAITHALVSTVLGFEVVRFLLGLGESGNFPAALKTVAEWFPKKERSLATGIFNSGSNIGAIVAPLTVPWIAPHWDGAGRLCSRDFSVRRGWCLAGVLSEPARASGHYGGGTGVHRGRQ